MHDVTSLNIHTAFYKIVFHACIYKHLLSYDTQTAKLLDTVTHKFCAGNFICKFTFAPPIFDDLKILQTIQLLHLVIYLEVSSITLCFHHNPYVNITVHCVSKNDPTLKRFSSKIIWIDFDDIWQ